LTRNGSVFTPHSFTLADAVALPILMAIYLLIFGGLAVLGGLADGVH
jgi:hypothetical protein